MCYLPSSCVGISGLFKMSVSESSEGVYSSSFVSNNQKSVRVDICGVGVDAFSFNEVVEKIISHVTTKKAKPEYVVTPNVQHVITLQNDSEFRRIYEESFLSVPDGVPLLWAARFLNTPLQGRVNGTDLFEKICEVAAIQNIKIFMMGGRPGAAAKAKLVLESRYPGINISGIYCPPYGFELNPDELAKINKIIRQSAPDILFVGLGAPKQEKWIYANRDELQVPVCLGIGVSFELVADMVKRAPNWMQKAGLEWVFRLIVEPKRLWKRYILGNPKFICLVVRQKLNKIKS